MKVLDTRPVVSIVIPAHNEERVIGRLLDQILRDAQPGELEIVVVANGCTDGTVAAATRDGVHVVDLAEPSKHQALVTGDQTATGYPRLYVDADIEIDTVSVRAVAQALTEPGMLAAAPERELMLSSSSWPVRAYYRVWSQLPAVQNGLFGRGVVAVNAQGHRRIAERPQVMGDDLYVHSRFTDAERRIVLGARAVVYAPRTLPDLVRRRSRAALGNAELATQSDGATDTTATSGRRLVALARQPTLWPSLPVFVSVTMLARRKARQLQRSGQSTWLRDESSRG
jgi:glycosyltransferase involved in cell wall biosynthesis